MADPTCLLDVGQKTAGYFRHRSRGEKPCDACTAKFVAHIARNRERRGRNDRTYPIVCAHCGDEAQVRKKSARFCSNECYQLAKIEAADRRRSERSQVVHVGPSLVSHLPERHPARLPGPRRTDWWKLFVSGPCEWCEEVFTAKAASYESRARYCSKRCQANASRRKRGRFVVPPHERLAIYERDRWTCQLCNEPVDRDGDPYGDWAPSLDHIVCQSWTLVPDHSPANLQLAHRWCNAVRGDGRWNADFFEEAC